MNAGKLRGASLCALIFLLLSLSVAAYCLLAGVIYPSADGKVKKDSKLTVDYSHMSDGYIMAKGPASKKRLKLRISQGKNTLTYDLNTEGEYEVFPLQMGSGTYKIQLYKNASGKQYSAQGAVSLKVELENELAAFLVPNQYVNYTPETTAVKIAEEICSGLTDNKDKLQAIRNYISTNIAYDFIGALNVKTGDMPDIDGCIERRMGVCQDLAALGCCMLRSQGIPAEFAVGYAGNLYHAWILVHLNDGDPILFDPTAELNGIPAKQKYSLERIY